MTRVKRLMYGLLVAVMLATPVAPVYAQIDPGDAETNFTVQNLDSAGAAQVQASYIEQDGSVAATVPSGGGFETIDPNAALGFPAVDSGLPTGFTGSAIVSGDKELAAFAQMFFDGLTGTLAAYEAFRAGSPKIFFPSLARRPGVQESSITIQSAESASTTDQVSFTITFFSRDGSQAIAPINDTMLKGTQKTYNLFDYALPETTPPGGGGWLGSAVVESASPLAGVAITHWQAGYSGAYSAVPAPTGNPSAAASGAGPTSFLPQIPRRVQNEGAANENWLQWAAVNVQNLDPDPAEIIVHWYDRLGQQLIQFNDTIPGNSSKGYNTRVGSDIPANPGEEAVWNALGDDLNGSVVIESTNGKNIVSVANLLWSAQTPVGLAGNAYTSAPSGDDQTYIPGTFRRRQDSSEANPFLQFSGLIVQNVGAAACNDFTVRWIPRTGEGNPVEYTDDLPPNISHGYNTSVGADMPVAPTGLGANFRGAVFIDAPGCSLTAVHNTLFPNQTESSTYSGFGK